MAAQEPRSSGLRCGGAREDLQRSASSAAGRPLRAARSRRRGATAKRGARRVLPAADVQGLLRELRGQQVRLERQNERLRRAEQELRASRDSYAELYDSAPLGYITLDAEGGIRELNLTAAGLLGCPRKDLLRRSLVEYVADSDRAAFLDHLRRCVPGHPEDTCEVLLRAEDRRMILVQFCTVLGEDRRTKAARYRTTINDITGRRQALEALSESEQKYRSLVEDSADGIVIVRGQEIAFVNRTLMRICGCQSEAEMLGRPFTDFVAPEDRQVMTERGRARECGEEVPGRYEFRALRKDGTQFVAELVVSRISLQGVPARQGVVRDVTARRRAENLARAERDLAVALAGAADLQEGLRLALGVAIDTSGMDCGGVYLVDQVSGALELVDHTGLSPEFVRTVSACEADSANARLVMADRAVCTERLCLGVPLGEGEHGEGLGAIAVLPMLDEGRVIGCLNVASHTLPEVPPWSREVLETVAAQIACTVSRLRAQEALRQEKDFAEGLLRTAQAIVLLLDTEGRIVRFNPYLEEISGYRLEEVQGRDWFSTFLPERDRDWMRRLFLKAIGGTPTRGNLNPIVTKDGRECEIEWYDKILKDSSGEVLGLLTIGQDVTERTAAEERLRCMEAQLAHVGRLSAMGEMVAGIAHEVSQPLYSILNFAKASSNLLAAAGEPNLGDLREWNREILAAAARAGRILNRLQRFARRTETRQSLIDLGAIVVEAVRLAGFETRRRGVAVELDPSPEVIFVRADRVQIQQVLLNLLRNACEAADCGSASVPQVRIRASRAGENVEVSVADNGPGLPPDGSLEIFEPFVTTKQDGLGMGLAISKTIVEAHGGTLSTGLTEGGGATFRFTLPAAMGGRNGVE